LLEGKGGGKNVLFPALQTRSTHTCGIKRTKICNRPMLEIFILSIELSLAVRSCTSSAARQTPVQESRELSTAQQKAEVYEQADKKKAQCETNRRRQETSRSPQSS